MILQTRVSEKRMKLFSQCTDHITHLLQDILAFSKSILYSFYHYIACFFFSPHIGYQSADVKLSWLIITSCQLLWKHDHCTDTGTNIRVDVLLVCASLLIWTVMVDMYARLPNLMVWFTRIIKTLHNSSSGFVSCLKCDCSKWTETSGNTGH